MPVSFSTEITLGNVLTIITIGAPIISFLWRHGKRVDAIERAAAGAEEKAKALEARQRDHEAEFRAFAAKTSEECRKACDVAERACEKAKAAAERVELLGAGFSAYRETMAGQMVTRDTLRDVRGEIRDELKEAIRELGDRFDAVVRSLLQEIMPRRLPPPGE